MATVRSISEKKLEANRRNARQSTGPKTDAGKQASRLNAVTHGLLAKAVVITAGDYREDAQEFAQLLDGLREQYTPEGMAEDLEVQQLALYYWRKLRTVRYEHGAIRTRTGDLREREERRREDSFDDALRFGFNLERSSRGIQYLIDYLEYVKQEVLDGTVSGESQEWLDQNFPDEFTPPDEAEDEEEKEDEMEEEAGPIASKDSDHQMVSKLDKQLRRLSPLRDKMAASEELNLESKINAAALPGPEAVDKLIRYETSNDRALGRALDRLECMQARRQKQGGTPVEKWRASTPVVRSPDRITSVEFDLARKKVGHRQAQSSPDAVGGPSSGVMTAAEVHSALRPWSAVARRLKKVAPGREARDPDSAKRSQTQ